LALSAPNAAARQKLEQFLADGEIATMLDAVNHLETCIDSLVRATNHLNALNKDSEGDLPQANEKQTIRNIRHGIQHADEWIVDERIAEGDAIAVLPMNDRLRIADKEITYRALEDVIRSVHRQTRQVMETDPKR
jgi:hypothetical protein